MKGAVLRHIHVLFCRKEPVVSQHAPAQGYASRVFPACLRHLSRVTSHQRPLNHLDFLYVVSVGVPDWSSILQLGAEIGHISSLSEFWVFGLKVPSQETMGLVCSTC